MTETKELFESLTRIHCLVFGLCISENIKVSENTVQGLRCNFKDYKMILWDIPKFLSLDFKKFPFKDNVIFKIDKISACVCIRGIPYGNEISFLFFSFLMINFLIIDIIRL